MSNECALISIIIPVYNVEKYIAKCIQSLLDQTYKNFEAIIVDDGSPDNSIKIAKELVGNDSRFVFLEKENGGLSSARNFGLDRVTGDYIVFLDSDDYYEVEALERIIGYFKVNPTIDILLFGFNIVDESHNLLRKTSRNFLQYSKKDILLSEEIISYSVSDKAYRREVWNNIRFVDGIIYEDKQIMPLLLYNNKFGMLDASLYNYLQRAGSIMHSYDRVRSLNSIKYIYQTYYDFLVSEQIYEQYIDYYQKSYIKFCFFTQLHIILNYSKEYGVDCQYLYKQLDHKIITYSNINKYYGLFSKQGIIFGLFKLSPHLVRIIKLIHEKLFHFLKGKK